MPIRGAPRLQTEIELDFAGKKKRRVIFQSDEGVSQPETLVAECLSTHGKRVNE